MCSQYLYNLHEVAEKNGDGQMADFVEVMLEEQASHLSIGDLMIHISLQPCRLVAYRLSTVPCIVIVGKFS